MGRERIELAKELLRLEEKKVVLSKNIEALDDLNLDKVVVSTHIETESFNNKGDSSQIELEVSMYRDYLKEELRVSNNRVKSIIEDLGKIKN